MAPFKRLVFNDVDREAERADIRAFLEAKNTENILWLHGKRGAGKTHLLELFDKAAPKDICVAHVRQHEIDPAKDYSYLAFTIRALEEALGSKLSSYESVGDSATIDDFMGLIGAIITPHFDVRLFRESVAPVSSSLHADAPGPVAISTLLVNFITSACPSGRMWLLFDAFDACDSSSFDFMARFLQKLDGLAGIRVIVSTNDDAASGSRNAIKLLQSSIQYKHPILVEPFQTCEPFFQILDDLLDSREDRQTVRNLAQRLNRYCHGYPADLWALLDELIRRRIMTFPSDGNGFCISYEKAYGYLDGAENDKEQSPILELFKRCDITTDQIAMRMLRYLAVQGFSLDFEDEANFLRLALSSYLKVPVSLEDVRDKLENLMLSALRETQRGKLVFVDLPASDALAHETMSQYRYRLDFRSLHDALVQQRKNSKECDERFYLGPAEYHERLSFYLLYAHTDGWREEAFTALELAMQDQLFALATTVADRIVKNSENAQLTFGQALAVAECYYRRGLFARARPLLIRALDATDEENPSEDKSRLAYAWHLRACCEHSSGNLEDSLRCHHRALELFKSEGIERYQTMSAMVGMMREFPAYETQAYNIFMNEMQRYEQAGKPDHFYPLLKLSPFFCDSDRAEELTRLGLAAAQAHGDRLSVGGFEISLGVQNIRKDKLDTAAGLFSDAADCLEGCATHDIAYALNDEAAVNMLQGKYREALTLLLRAQYWSETSYVRTAVAVNRMMCELHAGNQEGFKRLAEERVVPLLHRRDDVGPITKRRTLINLALGYCHLNDRETARRYAQMLLDGPYRPSRDSASVERYAYCCETIAGIKGHFLHAPETAGRYFTTLDCEPCLLYSYHT